MRYLALAIVALLLTVTGCAKDEEKAAPTAPPGDTKKMMDDATEKAGEEVAFKCADPECDKTKNGTLANPPS